MKILPITFKILTICGFWRPTHSSSLIKKNIYSCFSFLMCFFVYTFTLSHLVEILICANNFEDMTGSCFMLLSMLNVCCKMINILYFRKDILQLLKLLANDNCQACDATEENIEKKFSNKTRFITLFYTTLTETTCMFITIRTLFTSTTGILPFKAWIPYGLTSQFRYWATFVHQTIAHIIAANIQIANDTLTCGMIIQACMQLEILKNRLKKISVNIEEINTINSSYNYINYIKNLLIKCIKHHKCIIEYSEKLKNTLSVIIFIQFVISLLVLCSSIYLLSKMKIMSIQFMSLALYLFCMLYQIFLFCWYGNEIMLQSMDLGSAVYDMDWTILGTKEKKNLLIIMLLLQKPIKFTSTFLITLSIDSYCKILKTSYSVFNLLQRTSL